MFGVTIVERSADEETVVELLVAEDMIHKKLEVDPLVVKQLRVKTNGKVHFQTVHCVSALAV